MLDQVKEIVTLSEYLFVSGVCLLELFCICIADRKPSALKFVKHLSAPIDSSSSSASRMSS